MMSIASLLGDRSSISGMCSHEAGSASTPSNVFLQQRYSHQPDKMLHAMQKHGYVHVRSETLAVNLHSLQMADALALDIFVWQ